MLFARGSSFCKVQNMFVCTPRDERDVEFDLRNSSGIACVCRSLEEWGAEPEAAEKGKDCVL